MIVGDSSYVGPTRPMDVVHSICAVFQGYPVFGMRKGNQRDVGGLPI